MSRFDLSVGALVAPNREYEIGLIHDKNLDSLRSKVWSVEFKDAHGNQINNPDWEWNVKMQMDISQDCIQKSETKIKITVPNDDSFINESFILQVVNSDGSVLAEKTIQIIEKY